MGIVLVARWAALVHGSGQATMTSTLSCANSVASASSRSAFALA
jgi:hypothetical protein